MKPVGLRLRITLFSAMTVGLVLAAGALVLIGVLRDRLDDAATTAAVLRARDVAALVDANALPSTLALPGEESAFVQVVDDLGAVVGSTENIEGEGPVSAERPTGGQPLVSTQTIGPLDDGARMRVAAVTVSVQGSDFVVYAGESLEDASTTAGVLITLLTVGVPLLMGIVALVIWRAVGRTLQPVREISATMSEITTSDLHRRVPVPVVADEIGELAATVNETLARLDGSVERQRRFVADASHELRGPLAALRADLEISVTHPDRTDWPTVARDTLGDVERLQHLTDDLLLLARLDGDRSQNQREVDLTDVVREVLQQVRRDVTVETAGLGQPNLVTGDPDQLHRLVRNLVHNAEQHARTRLRVAVDLHAGGTRIIVDDDGPGIPGDQRNVVFERFARLDTARTRDGGGTGLGLAIVAEVAAAHRGSVSIGDSDFGGASFVVDIGARPSVDDRNEP